MSAQHKANSVAFRKDSSRIEGDQGKTLGTSMSLMNKQATPGVTGRQVENVNLGTSTKPIVERKRKCQQNQTDEAKKQRRLESNRRSAAASRQRRLDLINELKRRVTIMSEIITQLHRENEKLRLMLTVPRGFPGCNGNRSVFTTWCPLTSINGVSTSGTGLMKIDASFPMEESVHPVISAASRGVFPVIGQPVKSGELGGKVNVHDMASLTNDSVLASDLTMGRSYRDYLQGILVKEQEMAKGLDHPLPDKPGTSLAEALQSDSIQKRRNMC